MLVASESETRVAVTNSQATVNHLLERNRWVRNLRERRTLRRETSWEVSPGLHLKQDASACSRSNSTPRSSSKTMSDLPPAVPDVTVPSTEPSAPAAPAPVVEESAPQPAAAPTTESEASVPEPVVGDKRPAPEDEEEEQTKIQDKVDEPINVVPVDDKAIEAEVRFAIPLPAPPAQLQLSELSEC